MLRILHTADWHLGRPFHGDSLLAAQAAAVDFCVEVARDARVDAILIAGDLYDRALPPVDAVRLADEALCRLSEVAPVVVISGNHDSAARLGFGATLLDRAGVHIRTGLECIGEPVLVGDAAIYAIPYLEPDLVREELAAQERGHAAVMEAAMGRVREDRRRRGRPPTVVMAHAFVAGAAPSPSERDLSVGGSAVVPPFAFNGADYAALGHLHGPQAIGDRVRYSGSPVAFSFAEAGHEKSVAVVEVGGTAETVPVPVWRPLRALRGTLDDLLALPADDAWVHATLTDPVRPVDAMERLRARFPHCVALAFEPEGGERDHARSYAQRLRGLSDTELVSGFVRDVRGADATPEEAALLEEALAAGRVREAAR